MLYQVQQLRGTTTMIGATIISRSTGRTTRIRARASSCMASQGNLAQGVIFNE